MSAISRAVIVVAAGRGSRSGANTAKQYVDVAGKPVLQHTVDSLAQTRMFDTLVLVHPAKGSEHDLIDVSAFEHEIKVAGGKSRTESVAAGLAALRSQQPARVYIHDGARPLVSRELVLRLDTALEGKKGVVPTLPIVDAIKRIEGGHLSQDVDRTDLHRIQTPQAFDFDVVTRAYAKSEGGAHDCASIVMQFGERVARIEGDEMNFKVTYPEDFQRLERALTARSRMDPA